DTEGFGAGDANLYRYVGNRPTNTTDPRGLFATIDHERLTKGAIDAWAAEYKIPDNVRAYVTRVAITANKNQDLQFANYNRVEYHFSRPYQLADKFAENVMTLECWPPEAPPPSQSYRDRAYSAYSLRMTAGMQWDEKFQNFLRQQTGFFRFGGLGKVNCEA